MTTPGQVSGATQQAAGVTASTAKDEAAQVGQTAKSAASDVAGTASEQAGQVATEAVNQVKQLTDQARTQAGQQAGTATQKLSDSLRSLAGEVRDLSQGKADSSGTVAGLAQQLADKGEQVAQYLSSQGPDGLLREVRGFAARKPGSFLLGALAAGLATGRVVKGAAATNAAAQQPSQDLRLTSVQPVVGVTPAPVDSYPASSYETSGESYPSTSEPYSTTDEQYSSSTSSYSASTPIAHSDDSGLLDQDRDQVLLDTGRSEVPPYEPGSGVR